MALVASAATPSLAGASRGYNVKTDDTGNVQFFATETIATQIRSRCGRRTLNDKLSQEIEEQRRSG